MSKVRVSNGSPTLERVDARQADRAKPPVCRSLFGSVDRDEFARDVERQMRDMENASKEKWNYDFAKNEPLAPGDYEWQEVDAKEVPDFYTRPPRVKRDTSADTPDRNGKEDFSFATGDDRTALTTPKKRPSADDRDLPCQSKRPNVSETKANRCPTTETDPKT